MHDRLYWSCVARTLRCAFSLFHPDSFRVDETVHICCMAQAITGVVCLWFEVTWKCGSEVVRKDLSSSCQREQLPHQTQSSAYGSESRNRTSTESIAGSDFFSPFCSGSVRCAQVRHQTWYLTFITWICHRICSPHLALARFDFWIWPQTRSETVVIRSLTCVKFHVHTARTNPEVCSSVVDLSRQPFGPKETRVCHELSATETKRSFQHVTRKKQQMMFAPVQEHVVASLPTTSYFFCSIDFPPARRGVQESPRRVRHSHSCRKVVILTPHGGRVDTFVCMCLIQPRCLKLVKLSFRTSRHHSPRRHGRLVPQFLARP